MAVYSSCLKRQTLAAYVTLLVCCVSLSSEQEPTPLTNPVRGHAYPVHIGAEHHMVQGRISSEARVGTLVSSNVIMEGQEDADLTVHLRVEIRDSEYKRPHVYHPDIVINTTDPLNPQFEHPVIKFPNSSLPYGMEFVVIHTNAFYITPERYLAVNDFADLNGDTRIHFDVLLKDKLSETPYVSNSLPFVVEIEYPRVETNPNAALFAGVLIMTILVISLVIPFGVRAKRRHRAGKPVCGCGSADDKSDVDSMASQPDFVKNRAMSVGGKDNLAMMLDHSRLMNSRPSESNLHQPIQNRMVRSESIIHFQPQWMDPHLSDYYHRPDFSHLEELHQYHLEQQQQQQQQQQGNGGARNGNNNAAPVANGKLHGVPPQNSPRMMMAAPGYHGNGAAGGFLANGHHHPYSQGGVSAHLGNNGRFPNGGAPMHPDFMNLVNMRRNSSSLGNLTGGQLPYQSHLGPHNNHHNPYHGGNGGASISRGNSFNNPSANISRGNSFSNPNGSNGAATATNGLAFFRAPRGTTSNRSSSNSLYTYPANFNQGIEIPMATLNKTQGEDNGKRGSGSMTTPNAGITSSDTATNDAPKDGANGDVSKGTSNGVSNSGAPGTDTIKASSSSDSGYIGSVAKGVSNESFQPDDLSNDQAKNTRPEVEDERL